MIFEKQFQKICKYCDEILLSNFSTKEIVAVSWLHVIREHSEFTSRYYGLFDKSKRFNLTFPLKSFFFIFFRIFKNLLTQKNKLLIIGTPKQVDVLMISHFLNVNQIGKDNDFYFGSLAEEIAKLGKKVVIGLINHTDQNSKYVKSKWKILPKIPRIIFGKDIGIYYEFKILKDLIQNYFNIRKLNEIGDYFKKKVIHQLKKELFSIDTINNLKIYYQLCELLKIYNPKSVILIHEGHAHERVIFKALREVNKNIKCIGYQQACIFKQQHAIKRNLGEGYNPDIILTSGENPKRILEKNFSKENIIIKKLGSPKYIKKNHKIFLKKKIIV